MGSPRRGHGMQHLPDFFDHRAYSSEGHISILIISTLSLGNAILLYFIDKKVSPFGGSFIVIEFPVKSDNFIIIKYPINPNHWHMVDI